MAKIHPDHLCPDEGSSGPSVPRRKQIVNKKRSRSPSSDGDGQVSVDFPSTSEILCSAPHVASHSDLPQIPIQNQTITLQEGNATVQIASNLNPVTPLTSAPVLRLMDRPVPSPFINN